VGAYIPADPTGAVLAAAPGWPEPVALAVPSTVGLAVLAVAALTVGVGLYRAVERRSR
jgi:hypothetical protein